MPLDHDTAELTKNLLRDNDNSELRSIREARLDPLLGGNADWLGESSNTFEATFGDRLSSEEAGQLSSLVGGGGDPSGLARWFDELITAWENPEVTENGAGGPTFTDQSEVDGQPGWWQGYDTTDDTWKYTHSTGQPTDESDWLDQDTAFAAMSEDEEPEATGTLDDAEFKALADDVLSPALEQAIAEVDGAEDLSAEDVQEALELALAQVSAQ